MERKMQEIFRNIIKIVSFHTNDSFYSNMAKKLQESCIKFELQYEIKSIESKGSWVNNCAYKANFLLEKLQETESNNCIVWIDADAKIITHPTLFFTIENDFGIRAEPGSKTKKPTKRETISLPNKWPSSLGSKWFNSGTIFLRNVPSIISMINEWISIQQGTNKWDQWSLQEAWSNIQPKTEWLPREYCQIKKLHKENGAIILHDLASVAQKVDRK